MFQISYYSNMNTSRFIAKVLGTLFLSGGIGYIISSQHYRGIIMGFSEPSVSTFLFSILLIVAGISIVKYHNVWRSDWRIWITLFGWLCLIKGALFMIFPDPASNLIHLIEDAPTGYFRVAGIVNVIIGLTFGYFGFFNSKALATERNAE